VLGGVAESTGDRTRAIQYLEQAGQFATSVQLCRMEADAMFELAKLYRNSAIASIVQAACAVWVAPRNNAQAAGS
jgi:hypothetical protein